MKSMMEGRGGLLAYFHGACLPGKSLQRIRTFAYWTCTFLVAFEMTAGSLWGLLRIEYVRVVFAHLGYPVYLGTILGIWKVPFALVLFLPGFQRLKEWAYAGAVFNYSGAAASHFFVGYAGMGSITTPGIIGPSIFTVITIASWSLRPASRRLSPSSPPVAARGLARWIVPILIVTALFVLSWVFLPKGGPPGS
ncbi:MAG TPA: DoxX family protein [Candidatus Udaeobacter sp.]|nr:DoxX family protein [Candidatus Udaeobacter sp.]